MPESKRERLWRRRGRDRAAPTGHVAVIVAAFQAERWIEKTVRSIEKQRLRSGWTQELRIAVDQCEATSARLLELGVGHWWSADRVGPYVLRNSLILQAPADVYATFDADDVMEPVYLDAILALAGKTGIGGTARKTMDQNGRLIGRRARYFHGVSGISHHAWEKAGGFRAWMIAADSDFVARCQRLGIRVSSTRRALYRRRQHPGSLTRAQETRIGSELRQQLWAQSKALLRAGRLYVEPRTTHLERREP